MMVCPKCKEEVSNDKTDLSTGEEVIPEKGDMTTCIHCLATLQYENDLSLRELSVEEINKLPPDMIRQILLGKNAIKQMKKAGEL